MCSDGLNKIKRQWQNLSENQRKLIAVLGAVDAAGKSLALASLSRTDKQRVRGSKLAWGIAIGSVNTFGWLSWFTFGRRRADSEQPQDS